MKFVEPTRLAGTYVKFTQAGAAHVRVTAKGAGSGKSGPVSWMRGEIEMTGWKADLDALVQEAMALAKSIHVEAPMPRTVVEPKPMPPVDLNNSERDEIQQRVSNFRAHQERFAREREEFAASLLKRMLQRS
jgi:hypothetical protein